MLRNTRGKNAARNFLVNMVIDLSFLAHCSEKGQIFLFSNQVVRAQDPAPWRPRPFGSLFSAASRCAAGSKMAAPVQGLGRSEGDLLGHFMWLVCWEVSEKPLQVLCERVFCPEFLQECLKPRNLSVPCMATLWPRSPAWWWETLTQPMESTKTCCHGCCEHFRKPLGNLTCVPWSWVATTTYVCLIR